MRGRRFLAALLAAACAAAPAPPGVVAQGRTHVLVVVGLGGNSEYRAAFHRQATTLIEALRTRHGVAADHITYLGERVETDPGAIAGRSTRQEILQALAEIRAGAEPMDRLLVVLIGHGTEDRGEARFNVPGPDLTPGDLAEALAAFPTQTVAVVHLGSASGGFLKPLSAPNRIVITATRSARERFATEFGRFFIDAVAGEDADLDKDERTSLLEAFLYARQETARFYEEENELLVEHALLDDNGDGEGSANADVTGPDGMLAATFQLGGVSGTSAQRPDDPELARLYGEREAIQARIAELRAARDTMEEEAYLSAMEELLVELALKNREIRAREGGGGDAAR